MTTKKKNNHNHAKVVLLILDGWGLGQENGGNAIYLAKTPFIDSLYKNYAWTKLNASGYNVGLPDNQVGNSEAGHENLGAGRVVEQDAVKISREIKTGQFFKNPALLVAAQFVRKNNSALNLMGMLSNDQSPHSNPEHLLALLEFARRQKIKKVFLHLFTDGRDSPPRSSLKSIMALERSLKPNELIATVIGRYYAMDRKKDWSRTICAYNAMVGKVINHKAKSPQEGIMRAYNANITDEFIEPIIVYNKGKIIHRISEKDAIIFFNLRSDRARQLAKPFVQKDFEEMNPEAPKRQKVFKDLFFVAMTNFGPDLGDILTAYPAKELEDTLPILLKDKKQIYIAEREKYAHVTYFFNGGYTNPVAGEKRINIPSPDVKSYDQTPAMATAKISQKIIASLNQYDFICANFACPDMVGHTGNLMAGVKTAEAVDAYVKKIAAAALKKKAILLVTADHGNLELMLNIKTNEVITEHTNNPVPFVVVSRQFKKGKRIKSDGCLGNVAPTILKLFNSKTSRVMKESLI